MTRNPARRNTSGRRHFGFLCLPPGTKRAPLASDILRIILGPHHFHRTGGAGIERVDHAQRLDGMRTVGDRSAEQGRLEGPRAPQDDYGRSKLAGEEVVAKSIGEGLPALIARPCTVYGPGCSDGEANCVGGRVVKIEFSGVSARLDVG